MKLTKQQLKQFIKEELEKVLSEFGNPTPPPPALPPGEFSKERKTGDEVVKAHDNALARGRGERPSHGTPLIQNKKLFLPD